ncbi:glycosyl transferase family 2 [Dokdonia pacifica]|uniref:Glycosyl transferase family 2 n=1 Tax=Dokdonia pacifica TaxID=1627892 RepID=A0A238ZLC1_9FLAO|nr:glycosyltransferase [Dokdonia pacifica]GGG06916.1 glycosyl transferase family 2 [Dokdonia pacifica]SNR83494.1 Glycosyl transferase family 2 [Dokdonia pacifica]
MQLSYSFIIPVYNRPDEIKELLDSFVSQDTTLPYEIVIIEDGSSLPSDSVIAAYTDTLNITYLPKSNSGPGPSRNYGMARAAGNYFIILDSDCILPPHYVRVMDEALRMDYVDCFGGPDAAHPSFSALQKAINYSMTSFLTTGGIRGGKKQVNTFQPRSFNMGLSKKAFEASEGFGKIHPGEDPDLVLRLWDKGFKTRLLADAYVYHKRRISWSKFYKQVHKFGMVRPILNNWHPSSAKVTYWFPTVFLAGILFSMLMAIFGWLFFIYVVIGYFVLIGVHAMVVTKSIPIGIMAIAATIVQFYGYGTGFLKSTIAVQWLGKEPQQKFPHLFFK